MKGWWGSRGGGVKGWGSRGVRVWWRSRGGGLHLDLYR